MFVWCQEETVVTVLVRTCEFLLTCRPTAVLSQRIRGTVGKSGDTSRLGDFATGTGEEFTL